MIDKSTVIPRPTTKRQMSSPANCGVAHINLSDVVAKINNGPKSCTNPFLNGSFSISEINVNENQYNSAKVQTFDEEQHQYHQHQQKQQQQQQKNPFTKRRLDDISFFSFPTNGNIDESQTTNEAYKITETTETLIELNEPEAANIGVPVTSVGQPNNTPNIHNRSLSDLGSNTLTGNINEQPTATNPFVVGNLHETISEIILQQYSAEKNLLTLNHTLSRQSIEDPSNEQINNTPPTTVNLNELKRAISCDSVNSESSVLSTDLMEQQNNVPTVTGQLCVGLQYDK